MRHEPSTLLGKTTNPQNQIDNLKIKLEIKIRFAPTTSLKLNQEIR